jgi:RNA polymerase sigma-70 factor (ECF subfamily)
MATGADRAMDRYARGEDEAFGELYDEIAPRLLAYLKWTTRNAAQAEDLLQQTFLQMHRARGSFISGAAVLPWAFAIARRLVIDASRRAQHERAFASESVTAPSTSDGALETVQAKEVADRLVREMARLPEAHRVAFELVRREGLSVREAAEVLGTTVMAVKLRVHRAYVALRAVLGNVNRETGAD